MKRALDRGAVVKIGEAGEEPLFYFKSVEIGEEESFGELQKLQRKKTTTMAAFETTKAMIGQLGWSSKAKQSDLEACISIVSSGMHLCLHTLHIS